MTNNLKLRIILNTLDKYNYDSELDEAEEQITDLMREAYLTGKGTGWSEALGTEIQTTFDQWLEL